MDIDDARMSDVSLKEYIKMCIKATEVQDRLKEIKTYPDTREIDVDRTSYRAYWNDKIVLIDIMDGGRLREVVWLPRQRDLQVMACNGSYLDFPLNLIDDFSEFIQSHERCTSQFTMKTWHNVTMEQLWLAFVMERKYGKRWNGKSWVRPRSKKKEAGITNYGVVQKYIEVIERQ